MLTFSKFSKTIIVRNFPNIPDYPVLNKIIIPELWNRGYWSDRNLTDRPWLHVIVRRPNVEMVWFLNRLYDASEEYPNGLAMRSLMDLYVVHSIQKASNDGTYTPLQGLVIINGKDKKGNKIYKLTRYGEMAVRGEIEIPAAFVYLNNCKDGIKPLFFHVETIALNEVKLRSGRGEDFNKKMAKDFMIATPDYYLSQLNTKKVTILKA